MKRIQKGCDSMKDSVGAKIIEGLREFTEALENNEAITERFTCRTVMLDLMPEKYSPEAVKATRKLLMASQGIFAQFLGVSAKSVRAWEQGINTPNDIAGRFMDEIRRNPDFWRKRLRESITVKRGADVRCVR
jgi:DNA-binding transcriptional regulator YiaG